MYIQYYYNMCIQQFLTCVCSLVIKQGECVDFMAHNGDQQEIQGKPLLEHTQAMP